MDKNSVKWIMDWNYRGSVDLATLGASQSDWNQTLLTKINQISMKIKNTTFTGGANCVALCGRLKNLIETLEFYKDSYINQKYKVIVDDTLDNNTIFVLIILLFSSNVLYARALNYTIKFILEI